MDETSSAAVHESRGEDFLLPGDEEEKDETASSILAQFQATYYGKGGAAAVVSPSESFDSDEAAAAAAEEQKQQLADSCFWEILLTVYLPTLLQVCLDTSNHVRMLFVTFVVPLLVTYFTLPTWLTEQKAWKYLVLVFIGGDAKQVNANAWPPPALVLLAALTVFALVVHPEGYTWVVLRKIRDGIVYVLQSSSTCWAIVINNYGAILATVFALATFAALFFFAYVLRRTLIPRPNPSMKQNNNKQQSHQNNNKKKKKKGAHNNSRSGGHRGGGGHRSRGHQNSQKLPTASVAPLRQPTTEPKDVSSTSDLPQQTKPDESKAEALPALLEDKPLSSLDTCDSSKMENAEVGVAVKEPEKNQHSRDRSASVSTADDVTLVSSTDDLSFDSFSGRSTPTLSHPVDKPSFIRTENHHHRENKGSRKQQSRRQKKGHRANGATGGKNSRAAVPVPPANSRWDALKPEARRSSSSARRDAAHARSTAATPASSVAHTYSAPTPSSQHGFQRRTDNADVAPEEPVQQQGRYCRNTCYPSAPIAPPPHLPSQRSGNRVPVELPTSTPSNVMNYRPVPGPSLSETPRPQQTDPLMVLPGTYDASCYQNGSAPPSPLSLGTTYSNNTSPDPFSIATVNDTKDPSSTLAPLIQNPLWMQQYEAQPQKPYAHHQLFMDTGSSLPPPPGFFAPNVPAAASGNGVLSMATTTTTHSLPYRGPLSLPTGGAGQTALFCPQPEPSRVHAIRDNPFEAVDPVRAYQQDEELQIEAELQELGGQMVGSILDC